MTWLIRVFIQWLEEQDKETKRINNIIAEADEHNNIVCTALLAGTTGEINE